MKPHEVLTVCGQDLGDSGLDRCINLNDLGGLQYGSSGFFNYGLKSTDKERMTNMREKREYGK